MPPNDGAAPSAFLQDFVSREWRKGERAKKGPRASTIGTINFRKMYPTPQSAPGTMLKHADVDMDFVVPLSVHLHKLEPQERAQIGKLEGYWSELTLKLKSSMRAEVRAVEELKRAQEDIQEMEEEAESARKVCLLSDASLQIPMLSIAWWQLFMHLWVTIAGGQ